VRLKKRGKALGIGDAMVLGAGVLSEFSSRILPSAKPPAEWRCQDMSTTIASTRVWSIRGQNLMKEMKQRIAS